MKNMQKYMIAVSGMIILASAFFSISAYAVGSCGEKNCGFWAGNCKSNERCQSGFIYNACVPDTSCGPASPLTDYKINIFNASVIEQTDGFKLNITLNMTQDNLPFQLTIDLIDVNNNKHEAFCFNKTKSQENGYACDYFINPPVTYTQKGNKILMSPPIPLPLTAGKYYIAIGAWQPDHIGDPNYKYDYKEFQNLKFDISGQEYLIPKLVSGLNTFVVKSNMVGTSIKDFIGYNTKCGPNIWLFKSASWGQKDKDYKFVDSDKAAGLVVYCAS